MADSQRRPGLLSRLANALRPTGESSPQLSSSTAVVKAEPQPAQVGEPRPPEVKSLLPRYLAGRDIGSFADFIPLDSRGQVLDILGETGLAFVAYWYVATHWRAIKLSEAPLMVVEEDQDTGAETWLSDHELADVLDQPSPDYDMGELVERTSQYLDNGGSCLWVFDRNGLGIVARITPFRQGEFEILQRPGRLYGAFRVQTAEGPKDFEAEEVAYFRDSLAGNKWTADGKSRLDVAMAWLRLGEKSRQTIRDLLDNAVWPSLVVTTDPAWNPDEPMLELFKQELNQYAAPGNKGKAFASLGGGSAEVLAAKIRDLVPEEVLNRVESVVAAISGVPAVVLQFQVGMENSPWSQMEQARRMAYDDAIVPTWRKLERVLTRQLLRIDDEDPSHFIRFDRSKIASLQVNQLEATTIATMWGRAASLNERREKMGLEPVSGADDPEGTADDIPELTQPNPLGLIASGGSGDNANNDPNADPNAADSSKKSLPGGPELWRRSASLNERRKAMGLEPLEGEKASEVPDNVDEPAPAPTAPAAPEAKVTQPKGRRTQDDEKAKRRRLIRRRKVATMQLAIRSEGIGGFQLMADRLLAQDSVEIERIIRANIAEPPTEDQKYLMKADRGKGRTMNAILGYLKDTSQPAWQKASGPLVKNAADRSTAVIAADIGINFNLLSPHVVDFARKETAFLVKGISDTTRDAIQKVLADGLDAGKSAADIARDVADSGAFAKSRARLIARTESTRAGNGGPTAALKAHGKATKRSYTKTWSGALDDRERDEHVALEGETVAIDEKFSNGRDHPDEPNCRCALIYNEVEDVQ